MLPAIGVSHENMLQGTLKAIVATFFVLAAAFALFWHWHKHPAPLVFHRLLWLPLGLMAYALGSMAWSHAYLGGVETIRWFVFGLILFLGLNSLTLARATYLAWGIHLGAVLASLWAALQFWFDWQFFLQGANPASTFNNRNFFAEFLLCTLPFSVLLLTRMRSKLPVFLLAFSLGFNVVALMMTGTRSALVGLLVLGLLLPAIVVRYRSQCQSTGWRTGHIVGVSALLIATVLTLGSINTGNRMVVGEFGDGDALDRAYMRSLSMAQAQADEFSKGGGKVGVEDSGEVKGSFSARFLMWKATGRMMAAHPLAGVGAGAWEVQIPLYQHAGSQVEYSDSPHNELLQLLAEYGLVGWLFLLGLLFYLSWASCQTWADRSPEGLREAPLRALTLASLLALLLVSNAGFPWHLATSCVLFALSLALLAASDARLGAGKAFLLRALPWRPRYASLAMGATALCTALALYIAQQAVVCESRLLQATQIAQTISRSGQPNAPFWEEDKARMLQLLREGIAINPHYRSITADAAGTMAGWGDFRNATWVWESVLASRPNIVVMLAYVARGHIETGELDQAQTYFDRAKALQPNAPAVMALEVMLWSRTGKDPQAERRAQELLQSGFIDPDLVKTAYDLGLRNHNPALAILALERGIKAWPELAVDGWLSLGGIYDSADAKDEVKALLAYRTALEIAPQADKSQVLASIPMPYRARLAWLI